jgi:hypothetical protein
VKNYLFQNTHEIRPVSINGLTIHLLELLLAAPHSLSLLFSNKTRIPDRREYYLTYMQLLLYYAVGLLILPLAHYFIVGVVRFYYSTWRQVANRVINSPSDTKISASACFAAYSRHTRGLACRGLDTAHLPHTGAHPSRIRRIDCVHFIDYLRPGAARLHRVLTRRGSVTLMVSAA